MIGKQYAEKILTLAGEAVDSQFDQIGKVADLVFASMKNGGLLHVFGCGHSHMMEEELFYRAGGLAPINPIFETATMLHEGAIKSSMIERMSGYAPYVLDDYDVKPGEVMLIFSNSGINSFPIEMALAAQEKGLTVVAFTSMNYKDAASRHPDGRKLCDIADIIIDTNAPKGDAMLHYEKSGVDAVPSSSILAMTLLNVLVAEIIERFDEAGLTPPVFISGNVEGGLERNQALLQKHKFKVKAL
ncbi:MAG: SIS domain-containing protein [Oscillospiraceae bacterium]|nr:SIS domain-containing protein [Oscillospiraceae bacterium]